MQSTVGQDKALVLFKKTRFRKVTASINCNSSLKQEHIEPTLRYKQTIQIVSQWPSYGRLL